jgi:hypothetical protein
MNINDSDICQVLFEDIPSDDRHVTSIDYIDIDETYIIPKQQWRTYGGVSGFEPPSPGPKKKEKRKLFYY